MAAVWRAFMSGFMLADVTLANVDVPPEEHILQQFKTHTLASKGNATAFCESLQSDLLDWRRKLPKSFKALQVVDYCVHDGHPKLLEWYQNSANLIERLGVLDSPEDQSLNIDQVKLARFQSYAHEVSAILKDQKLLEAECANEAGWKHRMNRVVTVPWETVQSPVSENPSLPPPSVLSTAGDSRTLVHTLVAEGTGSPNETRPDSTKPKMDIQSRTGTSQQLKSPDIMQTATPIRRRPVPQRRQISDLVRDSKLETTFEDDGRIVCHVSYKTDVAQRQRRVRKEVRWARSKRIGVGGFGCVWLEKRVDGEGGDQLRAVKEISKHSDATTNPIDYTRELEAIAKFSHDKYSAFFVSSQGWYDDEQTIFISMEYHDHGDLRQYMKKPFSEMEARIVISQVLEGVAHMHDNNFAHRDLKPANILVVNPSPQWWVKIGDFGISKRAEDMAPFRTVIGTPAYLAPEVQSMQYFDKTSPHGESEHSYTMAVDLWATGIILFQLLTNQLIFPDSERLKSYVMKELSFPRQNLSLVEASDCCISLIEKLLDPAPQNRPSASEALEHPYFIQSAEPASQPNGIKLANRFDDEFLGTSTEPSAAWPTGI